MSLKSTLRDFVLPVLIPLIGPSLAAAQTRELRVHVCVGSDNVLHRVDLRQACRDLEKSFFLVRALPKVDPLAADDEKPETTARAEKPAGTDSDPAAPPRGDPSNSAPATVAPDVRRIRALEQRLRTLERRPRSRAIAPFEVIDRGRWPIVRVEPDGVRFFHQGQQKAFLSTSSLGATVTLGTTLQTHVFSFGKDAGFIVDRDERTRVDLGVGERGNVRLLFSDSESNPVAGLGQATDGTGAIRVAATTGAIKASLQVDSSGKGLATVFNEPGHAVAALARGDNPGGLLQIGDSESEPVVKAGVSANGRYGVVLAGPAAIFPANGLGLPGSFLLGSAK